MKHIYLILLIFLNFNITYSQTEEYNITSSDVTYLNMDSLGLIFYHDYPQRTQIDTQKVVFQRIDKGGSLKSGKGYLIRHSKIIGSGLVYFDSMYIVSNGVGYNENQIFYYSIFDWSEDDSFDFKVEKCTNCFGNAYWLHTNIISNDLPQEKINIIQNIEGVIHITPVNKYSFY